MPVFNTSTVEKKKQNKTKKHRFDDCSVSNFPMTGYHLVSTELIDILNAKWKISIKNVSEV